MGKIIQFENSAVNIALALREQFRKLDICFTDELDTPQGRILISDFSWSSGWLRKAAPVNVPIVFRGADSTTKIATLIGHEVEFVQKIRVVLSSPNQLVAAGASTPQMVSALDLELIFHLQINSSAAEVFLVITYIEMRGLPEIPSLQNIRQRIANQFPPQKVRLDIEALSGTSGKPVVVNAGIAITADDGPGAETLADIYRVSDTVVGIRIEIDDPPTSTAAWATFLAGNPGASYIPTLAENGPNTFFKVWNLFTDASFLTERVKKGIEDSLLGSGDFSLQGGIEASWVAPDGQAIVYLNFYGAAVDACDRGWFGSSDIDLRVQVPVEFSVARGTGIASTYQPGAMVQSAKIHYWKSDWDTFGCVLSTSLIWPYLGLKLMDDAKLEWLEFLGTIAIGPLVSIVILVEANKGGKIPSPDRNCIKTGDNEYTCTRQFESGSVFQGGLLELYDRRGRTDGLVLTGGSFWVERLSRGFHIRSVALRQFELDAHHFLCTQIGSAGLGMINEHPEDFVNYEAIVSVTFEADSDPMPRDVYFNYSKTDFIPPYICTARVRPEDDPLNVFAPYVSWDTSRSTSSPQDGTIFVRVPVTKVPAAYFTSAHRYPCRVLIHTSAGTRTITLPAIQQANAPDMKSLVIGAWARRVSECYAKSQLYNPTWKIDPSDFFHERHFWQLMVTGLLPDEQVSLKDQQGRVMSVGRSGPNGNAQLRAFLLPDAYDGQLSFRRSAAPATVQVMNAKDQGSDSSLVSSEPYIRIDVKQTQFLLQSEIENGEPIVSSASLTAGNRHGLLVVQASGLTVYDISRPSQPWISAHSALSGVFGSVTVGSQILVWGTEGIFVLDIDLELGEIRTSKLSAAPTLGLTSVGRRVFVLSQDEVKVWENDWRLESHFEAPKARALCATRTHLLVASDSRVKIYQTAGHARPKFIGEHEMKGLSQIIASEFIGPEHHFILKGSSRSELIDVSNPERVVVLGEFHNLPALGYVRRYRDLLIESDKNAMFLRLYTIGATALN